MVGLGNVNNTAASALPISTLTQSALNNKLNASSPIFTGTLTNFKSIDLDNSYSVKEVIDSAGLYTFTFYKTSLAPMIGSVTVNKTIFSSDLNTFSPLVNINCCGPVSSNPQIMGVHSGLLDSTIGKWAVIKLCSESTNAGASTIDFTYPDGSLGYYAGRICFNN
jgi:hypothetical protein